MSFEQGGYERAKKLTQSAVQILKELSVPMAPGEFLTAFAKELLGAQPWLEHQPDSCVYLGREFGPLAVRISWQYSYAPSASASRHIQIAVPWNPPPDVISALSADVGKIPCGHDVEYDESGSWTDIGIPYSSLSASLNRTV